MPFHYIVPSPSTALEESIQYRHSTYTGVNWVVLKWTLLFWDFWGPAKVGWLLIAHPPPIFGGPDIRKIFHYNFKTFYRFLDWSWQNSYFMHRQNYESTKNGHNFRKKGHQKITISKLVSNVSKSFCGIRWHQKPILSSRHDLRPLCLSKR